jgi:hypothetical protein
MEKESIRGTVEHDCDRAQHNDFPPASKRFVVGDAMSGAVSMKLPRPFR